MRQRIGKPVTSDRWERVKAVFAEATAVPEAERLQFVRLRSDGDSECENEILRLLRSEDGTGSFFARWQQEEPTKAIGQFEPVPGIWAGQFVVVS